MVFHRDERHVLAHPLLTINGAAMEQVSRARFLGVNISHDLSRDTNNTFLGQNSPTATLLPAKTESDEGPDPIVSLLLPRRP